MYIQIDQGPKQYDPEFDWLRWLGPLVVFTPLQLVEQVAQALHDSEMVVSTFEDEFGMLVYCRTESHHNLCQKVPTMRLVGKGKWVKKEKEKR